MATQRRSLHAWLLPLPAVLHFVLQFVLQFVLLQAASLPNCCAWRSPPSSSSLSRGALPFFLPFSPPDCRRSAAATKAAEGLSAGAPESLSPYEEGEAPSRSLFSEGDTETEGFEAWQRQAPAAFPPMRGGERYAEGARRKSPRTYGFKPQQQTWSPISLAAFGGSLDGSGDMDVGLLLQHDAQLQQQMEAVLPLSLPPETLEDLVEGSRRQHLLHLSHEEGPPPIHTSVQAAAAVGRLLPPADSAVYARRGTWWFPLAASYEASRERLGSLDQEAQLELQQNMALLQLEARQRRRRRLILAEALGRHGLQINPASWLCRAFVYLKRTPIRSLVFAVWRQKVLDQLYEPMMPQREEVAEERQESSGLAALEEDWRKHVLWMSGIDLAAHPALEMALLSRKEVFVQRRYLAVVRRHPSARHQFVPPEASESDGSSDSDLEESLRSRRRPLPLRRRGWLPSRGEVGNGELAGVSTSSYLQERLPRAETRRFGGQMAVEDKGAAERVVLEEQEEKISAATAAEAAEEEALPQAESLIMAEKSRMPRRSRRSAQQEKIAAEASQVAELDILPTEEGAPAAGDSETSGSSGSASTSNSSSSSTATTSGAGGETLAEAQGEGAMLSAAVAAEESPSVEAGEGE
ncbi:hypothetical protein cyc_02705 [Cyclospora cayetanensis]|uniref:Uncharacterized protein n=1 Tax=Cyclospora cayetanensis TaxID=88456 RepID=A0A1D3CX19_9EIME|nr:hypothetical protein cyc_02705 [Cyclospora cayetanensis]